MKIKPKFKIGDVVCTEDNFNFNPIEEVTSIGSIQAIHIYEGKSFFSERTEDGKRVHKNLAGKVTYTVSGFSLMPEEKDLQLFKED